MNHQLYTPSRHDGPLSHSVYPNIYFTPGRYSSRPTQSQFPSPSRYIPPPSRFIPPGLISPSRHHCRIPEAKDITSVNEEQVAPIRDPESACTKEHVQKYKDWRLRKGAFGSPERIENGLTMEITMPHFLDFKKALGIDDDEKFPRYRYDAASSLLTIQCMPGPIHEKIVSTVSGGFNVACGSLPASLQSRIDIVGNQQFSDFQGAYDGFEKTPDTAVQITNAAGKVEVKFVLEVGVAETYPMLVQDAKTWLEGREAAAIVMLVKMDESPAYTCPTKDLSDDEFTQLEFPPRREIDVESFTLGGLYGPAYYKGFSWVGGITGFVEIWKRDSSSGLATLTPPGRLTLFDLPNTSSIDFWLHDFIAISPGNDRRISINWNNYINNLGRYIRELAADRCRRVLRSREGRADLLDGDYQP